MVFRLVSRAMFSALHLKTFNQFKKVKPKSVMDRLGIPSLASAIVIGSASGAFAQNHDWAVDLRDLVDPVPAGGEITYVLKVSNSSLTASPVTTVDLTLPNNTEFTGISGEIGPCTPTPATGPATVTCDVPAIPADQSVSGNIVIQATRNGVVAFTAAVPTAGDPLIDNNTATETTSVQFGSDIDVSISGPASAVAGDIIPLTLNAENLGPDPLLNATLRFPIPSGMTITSPAPGCSLSSGAYLCTIAGPIAVGDSVSFPMLGQVTTTAGSGITALVSSSAGSPSDPINANDTATHDINITAGSDLRIRKQRSPSGQVLTGDDVTFRLSAFFTGDSPTGVQIVDTLPDNYSINSVTPPAGSDWTCAVAGQTVTCDLPAGGAPGANVSLGEIQIETTTNAAGTVTNSATISAAGPTDPNPANNTGRDGGVTIRDPYVDLAASKSGPMPALVVVGNDYDYQIQARHVGTAPFFGTLVMTDNLPAGLTFNGITTANGWTCTPAGPLVGPAALTCTFVYEESSPLRPNQSAPAVTINTTVTNAGQIENSMTVSLIDPNLPDVNPGNDTAVVPVTGSVGGDSADISIQKTRDIASLAVGDLQTFTLEISNSSATTSTNISVTDNIQNLLASTQGTPTSGFTGYTIVENSASGVNCSTSARGGNGVLLGCTIASLPTCTPGTDCPTITFSVHLGHGAPSRTNTAEIISNSVADPDLTNNSASVSFDVEERADVTVSKQASRLSVPAGQELRYVITARNNAPNLSPARNVEVTDSLPANMVFVSATPSSGGTCSVSPTPNSTTGPGNDQVVCDLGDFVSGGQRTVTVVLRPTTSERGTQIVNNASVTTTSVELDSTNNSTSASSDVTDPVIDLQISKTDSVDPVAIPDSTTYTLTVRNAGPSHAENVVVTDTMPTGNVQYRSHTVPSDGTCSSVPAVGSTGGTLTCTFPLLKGNEVRQITVVADGSDKGVARNSASVTSTEHALGFDTSTLNDTAEETTTVRTRADVQVTSKTANPTEVNVTDTFDFIIEVANPMGSNPSQREADDVVVSDTLPSNMVLTGTPVVVATAGSISTTTCTGTSGGTSFSCSLGTLSLNGAARITAPVRVTSVTSNPQTVSNTASIVTSSLDIDPSNNSATGSVTVHASTISGVLYRDFNDDGTQAATDTGIAGSTMSLTGTAQDGSAVTRSTTTDATGAFSFTFLPEGTYSITRADPSEDWLNDGTDTVGTAGGSTSGPAQITGITLGGNTDATGYLFTMVPQARVGLAKTVQTGPTPNPDGSFNVTFRILAENFSLEALTNIEITDQLSGATPAFGTHVALGAPASDTLATGNYTLLSAPSGSCGTANPGFNGDTNTALISTFDLNAGATCTMDVSVRVRPQSPLPPVLAHGGRFQNQAQVTAEGVLSAQNESSNVELSDLSDNGTNPDADNNGSGRDSGEDDPTPVNPAFDPAIALVKTADIAALSPPPAKDDVITYNFAVTNTGDVNLYDVTVTDPLTGIQMSGAPIPVLAPGATNNTTYTATYALSQLDVDAGEVVNQASVIGTDPYDTEARDLSGTLVTNDTPLTTVLAQEPSLAIIKTADASALSSPVVLGQEVAYSFTITNTGNVTLTNVRLEDPLPGLTLTGSPIATLAPGETDSTNFTAIYPVAQSAINAAKIENSATAFGTPPTGPEVSDISGATLTDDQPNTITLSQNPDITLVKEADDSAFLSTVAQVGDEIPYTFTITNTGNVTLTTVTIEDILPGVVLTNNPLPTLEPGIVSTDITGIYALKQADIDRGQVDNTATVTGHYNVGTAIEGDVTDTSSDIAIVAPIEALPETFPPIETNGGVTTTVLKSDSVINKQADLTNVSIRVLSSDPALTLDPTTGLITLAPDMPAGAYLVSYEICAIAFPTVCDGTTETVTQAAIAGLDVVKTQDVTDNGDGVDGVGDTITYTIAITNIGNTPVEDVAVTDDFRAMDGSALTLDQNPVFDSADAGSAEGSLEMGETATYTADFIFSIAAVSGGGTSNSATASALPIFAADVPGTPKPVDDLSDDGDDSDGNSDDDRTEYAIESSLAPSGLTVNKTTPRSTVERGSTVPYTITIRNENPVASGKLNAMDILPAGFLYSEGSATLDGVKADVIVEGRVITWPDIPVPPLTTVTLTLSARVTSGADVGEHVNTATIRHPENDTLLAAPATATVRILPEPVFDCGDVIGRVFDDSNGDGYQNDGETGIAAARVAGVDGTVITTDEFGRFHVPCAMLPADRGSNFILKLDTASLPSGYRVTSENPRVIRLTPGKMSEINFGASLSRVVRVDLNINAFTNDADGQPAMKPEVTRGISALLQQISDERVHLRLAFHLPEDAGVEKIRQARALRRIVERHIRREWRRTGRVRLLIEHIIVRPQ